MSSAKTLFMQIKLSSSIIQFAKVLWGGMKKPHKPNNYKGEK